MDIELIKASAAHKQVIANLMQFYQYDFSEYTGSDPGPNGLFNEYPHLEVYWTEENQRFPYIIKQEDKYIGFVLVRIIDTGEKSYFSIAEFFILRKYRLKGFGRLAAEQVFNIHRGNWEVYQMGANMTAQAFWRKTITAYTKGKYEERLENGRTIQCFIN
jgi:predicted acetyltransferase